MRSTWIFPTFVLQTGRQRPTVQSCGKRTQQGQRAPLLATLSRDCPRAPRESRREQGPNARTPIIAVTANAMRVDQERCLEAGTDDYVAKPLEVSFVREALDRQLTRRS